MAPAERFTRSDNVTSSFFAGTYFPKEGRYGLPGFAEILPKLAQAYREQGARIAEQNARLKEALASLAPSPAEELLCPKKVALRDFSDASRGRQMF